MGKRAREERVEGALYLLTLKKSRWSLRPRVSSIQTRSRDSEKSRVSGVKPVVRPSRVSTKKLTL
jgi:hypothetical protein